MHRLRLAAVGVVAFVGASAGVVVANHQFPDVATDSAFHQEVSDVADAGIVTGFPDGGFRPRDPVNRQQAAAWLRRGLGRVSVAIESDGVELADTGVPQAILTVTIEAGGAQGSGGEGYVLLDYALLFQTASTDCPCPVFGQAFDGADPLIRRGQVADTLEAAVSGLGAGYATLAGSTVFPVEAGATHELVVEAAFVSPDDPSITVGGEARAVYVPFGDASVEN